MLLVKGDRVRTLVDYPDAVPGVFAAPAGTLGTVETQPTRHGGYGIILDGDPTGLPADYAPREIEPLDPTARAALAEDNARKAVIERHPDAAGFTAVHEQGQAEPLGWSFSAGHGANLRYGVVARDGDATAYGLYVYRTKAERALMYGETAALAARRAVRRGCPSARGFEPVMAASDDVPRGWTFSTGRGHWARFGAVTADCRIVMALTTSRAEAAGLLLDDADDA
ncbi:hypothetical protein [[Kitasatospora] papulosa]|uniref:hypothetical protein n=1 Tax=[Kitasatospora] papulosa TaxID=1464011 RepID=UPI0036A021AC